MDTPNTQPDEMTDSRAQLLAWIPDDPSQHDAWDKAALTFEPAELSEIVDGLYITSRDGVGEAMVRGHFVINTTQQGELKTSYHAQISIYPSEHTNIIRLNALALLIKQLLRDGQKVTVHCSMGMERSVLAVAWFLHTERDMSLDEAYDLIKEGRPIAEDRRWWACELNHWHSNESQDECRLG